MIRRFPYIQIKTNSTGKSIILYGKGFNFDTGNGLYLSSSNFNGTQVYCDFYSNMSDLSSLYPPFSGYPVWSYNVINDYVISFSLSSFTTPQKLDIIYAGPSGYIKASDGLRFTYIQIVTGFNINFYVSGE